MASVSEFVLNYVLNATWQIAAIAIVAALGSISLMAHCAFVVTAGSFKACFKDGNASALRISPSAAAAPTRTSTLPSDKRTLQSAATARPSFNSLRAQDGQGSNACIFVCEVSNQAGHRTAVSQLT